MLDKIARLEGRYKKDNEQKIPPANQHSPEQLFHFLLHYLAARADVGGRCFKRRQARSVKLLSPSNARAPHFVQTGGTSVSKENSADFWNALAGGLVTGGLTEIHRDLLMSNNSNRFVLNRLMKFSFPEKLRILFGKFIIIQTSVESEFFAGEFETETYIQTAKFFNKKWFISRYRSLIKGS